MIWDGTLTALGSKIYRRNCGYQVVKKEEAIFRTA